VERAVRGGGACSEGAGNEGAGREEAGSEGARREEAGSEEDRQGGVLVEGPRRVIKYPDKLFFSVKGIAQQTFVI
jgi:hypothetical protein